MAMVGKGLESILLAVVVVVGSSKIDREVCENVLSDPIPCPFSLSPSSSFVIHVVMVLVVVVLDVNEEGCCCWLWLGSIGTCRECSVTASTVAQSLGDDVVGEAESSQARTATFSGACSDMSVSSSCCWSLRGTTSDSVLMGCAKVAVAAVSCARSELLG